MFYHFKGESAFRHRLFSPILCLAAWIAPVLAPRAAHAASATAPDPVPKFSTEWIDRSVSPSTDFYRFAAGNWLRTHPVPDDKARWGGFDELQERNWRLIRTLLDDAAAQGRPGSPESRLVGAFHRSALDTNRIESLKFSPIKSQLREIQRVRHPEDILVQFARFHLLGLGGGFELQTGPDPKQSSIYAITLFQGGLGLPDRDYYLADGFRPQRDAYRRHVARMFELLGETGSRASELAGTILDLETALANASRSRVDLRDDEKNYHRKTLAELANLTPDIPWTRYLREIRATHATYVIVGQPEFFTALESQLRTRSIDEWKTYLRWHLLNGTATHLHQAVADESFAFFGTTLRGQPKPEPRWQRSARIIDHSVGESLGKLYVEKHFPPEARQRMAELIDNLRAVFRDRLGRLEWMSEPTRVKALAKFDRFTQKIGHPGSFRDYSAARIRPDDFVGNIHRSARLESRRLISRIGQPVDKTEWGMTPQTVNAYFNPVYNEIVFPAGILQPPFFDLTADDPINYGAIGVVIGHEITHGYDDQGRRYDAEGNLRDWWSVADGAEFDRRARKLVEQYGAYEPLPGMKVNGQLTLGENIADLGGTSIAFEALQRALQKDPSRRQNIDGFTPEQRFFLSLAQLWRTNFREAELRRRLTVDPHSPGPYRAIGPHVNLEEFYAAFDIRPGTPMYRSPESRAKIW